jgi:hypothetical protein
MVPVILQHSLTLDTNSPYEPGLILVKAVIVCWVHNSMKNLYREHIECLCTSLNNWNVSTAPKIEQQMLFVISL